MKNFNSDANSRMREGEMKPNWVLQSIDAPILKSSIAFLDVLDQRRITPPLMEESYKRERERERDLYFQNRNCKNVRKGSELFSEILYIPTIKRH